MLPLLARVCLALTDPAVREFVTGDLEETCAAAGISGRGAARRWAARQALRAMLANPWRPRRGRHRTRGDGFMRTLLQDLRYGARMVRKQPVYSLVVVLTLALAIGANSVIFSFVNVLLLRPLPLRDQQTLGWIFTIDPHRGTDRGTLSIPEFLDYRTSLTSFSALAASVRGTVTLSGRGEAQRLVSTRATANLPEVWGLSFAAGRGFSAGADAPGAPAEVVLANHYWRNTLGGDPSIVGQALLLDGRPTTVVGVLAPDIEIGNLSEIDVWLPLELSPSASREDRILRVNGRLAPGVPLQQAQAEVVRVAQTLAHDHPKTNEGWSARVAPTTEAMTGTDTYAILALLGVVVGLVLLIACANLANLVLSRATGRRRELAVRSALGASRGRVIRQMLTENLIYGLCGGAAGVLVAQAGLLVIKASSSEPFFALVSVDRNVLLFTGVMAMVTPMLFGLLPALASSRTDVNEALKDSGTRGAAGGRTARSRSVLIVAQMGLAVMLLVLAGLLVQAMVKLTTVPLGFDAKRILTLNLDVPAWRYANDASVSDYYDRLLARIRAVPGVDHAAIVDRLPMLGSESTTTVAIEGKPAARPEDQPWAIPVVAGDAYFTTLGVPILAGRAIDATDTGDRPPAAVVNHEMARRYWGSDDGALGARISLASDQGSPRWLTIVGVAGDIRRADREGFNPQVFTAAAQQPRRTMGVLVAAADPAAVQAAVREQVRALDANVPIFQMQTLEAGIDVDLSSSRVLLGLFISFAVLALALAASGLYAVVSYAASQRTQEIGVRVALGAVPGQIARMMLRQTALLVGCGVVIGLAGGRLLAVGAASLLFEVSPSDPATYAGVSLGLAAVAMFASYGPVRRACRIDPVRALRLE
jgi:putative ABC transport system permease protein